MCPELSMLWFFSFHKTISCLHMDLECFKLALSAPWDRSLWTFEAFWLVQAISINMSNCSSTPQAGPSSWFCENVCCCWMVIIDSCKCSTTPWSKRLRYSFALSAISDVQALPPKHCLFSLNFKMKLYQLQRAFTGRISWANTLKIIHLTSNFKNLVSRYNQ